MALNDRQIAKTIEARKAILGIPWTEVAARCGIDDATLHRLRGDAQGWDLKLSTLEAIADGLGLRMCDFWAAE